MQATPVPGLLLRRTLNAPPERVYEAWTNPKVAQQFICPESVTVPAIELDVRVGGAYRIVMRKEDGEEIVVRGVYREVVPNRRLAMTWRWEEDDPKDEYDTLLSIDFSPHGSGTELTLRHEQFAKAESRDNHEHGWSSILDKLEGLR